MGDRYTLQNGGSGGILVFGGKAFSGCVLYGRGVVRRRQWRSSVKQKGKCSDVCSTGATGVSFCTMETVIQRELILPCQRASFSGDAVECLS
jgi:hypothetical protein